MTSMTDKEKWRNINGKTFQYIKYLTFNDKLNYNNLKFHACDVVGSRTVNAFKNTLDEILDENPPDVIMS